MTTQDLPYQISTTQGVLSKIYSNFKTIFLNAPRYDLPADTYWCDIYKLEVNETFSKPYAEEPSFGSVLEATLLPILTIRGSIYRRKFP